MSADDGARFLDDLPGVRIVNPAEIEDEIFRLYDSGLPKGSKTGWSTIDALYTVAPGQWTLVTGYPSSGKSEWVDNLLVNLTAEDWRFVVFSPENQPLALHSAKLLEKILQKPFGDGPRERMTKAELGAGMSVLTKHFRFVCADQDAPITAKAIIDEVQPALAELGGRYQGVVIDPYNEMDHYRDRDTETEYISKLLSTLRGWARSANIHLWLVAHPRKTPPGSDGKLPTPHPQDVSGSQHFWNKCDVAITVHRMPSDDDDEVGIVVHKCRFKHIGRRGSATLRYDLPTGTYIDRRDSVGW